jgi:class 3 adenylate cyclase
MEEGSDTSFDVLFLKSSKHVPRILRKQLLTDLINQLRSNSVAGIEPSVNNHILTNNIDHDSELHPHPTIERFHGTLLFVDISGFTILSQKLNPERLRSFINAYFKRLIDIVQKYDGEVIKFAGDALFIIWQTKVNSTGRFKLNCMYTFL